MSLINRILKPNSNQDHSFFSFCIEPPAHRLQGVPRLCYPFCGRSATEDTVSLFCYTRTSFSFFWLSPFHRCCCTRPSKLRGKMLFLIVLPLADFLAICQFPVHLTKHDPRKGRRFIYRKSTKALSSVNKTLLL